MASTAKHTRLSQNSRHRGRKLKLGSGHGKAMEKSIQLPPSLRSWYPINRNTEFPRFVIRGSRYEWTFLDGDAGVALNLSLDT